MLANFAALKVRAEAGMEMQMHCLADGCPDAWAALRCVAAMIMPPSRSGCPCLIRSHVQPSHPTAYAEPILPPSPSPLAPRALQNKAQRQSYLDQCQAFIGTIEESLAKQAAAVDAKRAVRDGKAGELQRLVDAQRAYYKAVKEFQEECDRNEALSAAVARREAETAAAGGEA